uniref:Otopetrin n=1 Tax=Timema cristinae TaxID=61476 RepID=A0A7R9GRE0_TIMCR|nr:unnamed protein product [Timema cristinae]
MSSVLDPNETESGSFSESLDLKNSIAFLPDKSSECWRSQIMKNLLRNSSPFLFPCTVEYSLLCTVILAVMWRMACNSLDSPRTRKQSGVNVIYARSTSQFSVDCASAYKGLIAGLLVTVISTITLILFFELIRQPKYAELAVFQVNVWEALVLGTSIAVVILCYMKMKTIGLRRQHRDLELEHILLFVTQFGVFLYTLFHIIGAYFMMDAANNRWDVLRIVTPVSALVQSLCQTLLVLDAWRRGCSTPEQVGRKPGRQMVTFLLVANMVIWIVNRLVNNRAESYPEQMEFYGVWAWTIITHMCMPLVVCYRFQSSVCLYEPWNCSHFIRNNHILAISFFPLHSLPHRSTPRRVTSLPALFPPSTSPRPGASTRRDAERPSYPASSCLPEPKSVYFSPTPPKMASDTDSMTQTPQP